MSTADLRITKPLLSLSGFLCLRTLFAAMMAMFLASCASGPDEYTKTVTRSLENTSGTFLAGIGPRAGDPRDGRTGIRLVSDGPEALALRLALAEKAERTIDAQYYLLHNDETGHLYAWSLVQAAERGVRVRLLLDDMDVAQYDAMSAALDKHPNIEIRLFNPFKRGAGRNLAALFEFNRVTRRMHNKSMTGDGIVSLIGGRNIGNEYFAAREDSNYNDLDVLAVGQVAREVSRTFDDYWNSPYAVPASVVVQDREQELSFEEVKTRLSALASAASKSSFGSSLTHDARKRFAHSGIDLTWAPAKLIADPPEKAAGDADANTLVAGQMMPYLDSAVSSLYVSSAYFVPRRKGIEYLSAMSDRGVDVNILTNSMDSTDVLPVYGKYATAREELLEAGVNLYELRSDAERADRKRLGLGLSQSSLHTKAFILDEQYLFIGSFNWDPRSVWLNNEMGVLIESPALARETLALFKEHLRKNTYKLQLDGSGGIDWLTYRKEEGVNVLYREEPSSSGWRVFKSRLFGILPFGRQL